MHDNCELEHRLVAALGLSSAPVAITFHAAGATPAFDGVHPPPAADGRTGAVPAGCVFWMHAEARTFTTRAPDHANCSVGSLTHGFIDLETAAAHDDVASLVEAGWVSPDGFPDIPVVAEVPEAITYGPLREARHEPDVVLVRTDAAGVMKLLSAVPDARVEGKPQCRIVVLAKDAGVVAVSAGCALSRARTGMPASELTGAIPGARLAEVITAIEAAAAADAIVVEYARADAARFAAS
jgi:uncharacterized protein (DUF169 family)